jgi:excisionase family DNA binding protein
MPGDFVYVPDAAKFLKVSRFTVWRYIDSNLLPAERHGRDWAIPREALEAFQKPRRGRPKAETQPPAAPPAAGAD